MDTFLAPETRAAGGEPRDVGHRSSPGGPGAPSGIARGQDPRALAATLSIVLVDERALVRECLTCSLLAIADGPVQAFSRVGEWLAGTERPADAIVLLGLTEESEQGLSGALDELAGAAPGTPVVLFSDIDEPDRVVAALKRGVKGFIPTGVSLQVAVEALRLVGAGGLYVPASSLLRSRNEPPASPPSKPSIFTARQAAVVEALRRGKANKTIAYELNMRESTVKVHVRNIMRKLKARNRTEVAFITNSLLEKRAN
jgi:DNA-binding NarL/FixJ family response regulator